MQLHNATVLITGTNRGIGLAFAREALARGARKSAAWALTNGLRHDLRARGTQVLGLHMGFVDTDLTRGIEMPKSTPEAIVRQAFDGLEAGAEEVLGDELTQQVRRGLSTEPGIYLRDARA